MKIVFYVLLPFLTLVLQINTGLGQEVKFKHHVYSNVFTTEDGLSQNNVSNIAKDPHGFIWIGTGDGLNRFDGYSFLTYHHSAKDSGSLTNDGVRHLLIDSQGRLWVGTYNGLNLYDADRDSFSRFLMSTSGGDNAISHNTILALLEDRDMNLWVGTYWGLNKINLETLSITSYYSDPSHKSGQGLSDNAVTALLEDRGGKIWAFTAKGIDIIGPAGVEQTIQQSGRPGGLTSKLIVEVTQDTSGAIYLATNGDGLLRLENEDDRTFEYFTTNSNGHSLGSNTLSSLEVDRNGTLIVGTDGAGMYRFEGNGHFSQILDRRRRILDHGSIQGILIDDQNNYWFGLFGGGLGFIPGDSPRLEHYQYFDSTMEQMLKSSVLAIAEDHDKNIWIGTDGAGLYKFDPVTKHFQSFRHRRGDRNSLSTDVVRSLLVDHANNLYIGTYAGGLNFLDTRTMRFSRYLNDPQDTTTISTNHVWSLLEDRKGRIFVGQLGGLDEFLTESKTFRKLKVSGTQLVNANTASVFAMQMDQFDNIWMGTRLAGVHRYDPATRSFRAFVNDPSDPHGFPSNEIVELQMDAKENLLVGTYDKGLLRLNPQTFSVVPAVPAYEEENVTSVLEDASGNLWFTSFDGLHRYRPETGEILNFTAADGMQGMHFNEAARLKSSTGAFYFGGTNGLNVFYPERMRDFDDNPTVVFTQLSLFHDVVGVNDDSGLLTESLAMTEQITFSPEQRVFSIEFACLEYKFPKTNRYRYLLEGFDNAWNDIGENRTATYTNLPPGKYTLKVLASNANGHWNEVAATIGIVITPRWHQRSDVRIVLATLLVALLVLSVHLRTSYLVKAKQRLEQLVEARTEVIEVQRKEIKEKNEKLEQAYEEVNSMNEELQALNAGLEKVVENRTNELRATIKKLVETDEGLRTFLYRSSHDLRGPLTSLLGLAQVAKMQNEQETLIPYFGKMESTTASMMRLLKRLTETASLFRAARRPSRIITDEFFQSVLGELESVPGREHVRIEVRNRIGYSFVSDPVLLSHIVFNLMENSIMFRGADDPAVICTLSGENGFITINVEDNASGICAEMKEKIFKMFYRGSEKSVGNGLGLFMVMKALEILEGSISFESVPGHGTKFMVRIPVTA